MKKTRVPPIHQFAVVGVLVTMTYLSLPKGGRCDAPTTIKWLAGRAMESQLAQPVSITWAAAPLRATMTKLAQSQHVAMWLDRRVDPGLGVNLVVDGQPLRSALGEVARSLNLGVGHYGAAMVYLGPPGVLARLQAASARRTAEAKRRPAAAARRFLQAQPMRWDDFATPRELLVELAATHHIRIREEDRVPHDLWPAADLPPLSLIDRLTLILGQFDLSFEFLPDEEGIRIVPLPDDATSPTTAETWEEATPTARKAASNTENALEQLRIERLVVKEQPLGEVLRQLAARLKLEVRVDESSLRKAGKSLERHVSFHIEKASVDDLFDAMLRPEGLAFRRRGATVEIFAAE